MSDVEEFQRRLVEAHEQLLERDNAFRFWRDELRSRDEKIEALERANAQLVEDAENLTAELRAMQDSRVWQVGLRYRSARDAARRALRLGGQRPR